MIYPNWLPAYCIPEWDMGWWFQFLLWTEFTDAGRWMTIPMGLILYTGLIVLMVKIDGSDN